ncbi:hypothetical protein, partial [Klebsiella pneumoniae]|uniref:hypothetical protein n=1 Tax=Klebsiella pneumoniae TaxID=573 RepID=UPI003C75565F
TISDNSPRRGRVLGVSKANLFKRFKLTKTSFVSFQRCLFLFLMRSIERSDRNKKTSNWFFFFSLVDNLK